LVVTYLQKKYGLLAQSNVSINFTKWARACRYSDNNFSKGNKFGLFLILVSQRPNKLDDLVLTECGNKASLHLDSQSIVDRVIKTLGLDFDNQLNEKGL
jgi:DNA helicase HerA-like ATPase